VHFFTPTTKKIKLIKIVDITTCLEKNFSLGREKLLPLIVTILIFKDRYHPPLLCAKTPVPIVTFVPERFFKNGDPPGHRGGRNRCVTLSN
jgi:hypothetical protein